MPREDVTFMLENADILFKNFSGEETPFNAKGKRNFCAILPHELASQLAEDGWNVKILKAKEDGDEDRPYIKVSVGYKAVPPKIYVLTSSSRTQIGEDLVATLDYADIKQVDFIARAYNWNIEATQKSGIAAYLQTMFITIDEDPLEAKYAGILSAGMVE